MGSERHRLKHKRNPNYPGKEDVLIIKSEDKNPSQWKLGIVEELIMGRDCVFRGGKLRAGKSHVEQAVQHLYPLELTCDNLTGMPTAPLNPSAPTFRPRRDAAVTARHCIRNLDSMNC